MKDDVLTKEVHFMSFDGFMLHSMTQELKHLLQSGRVTKVQHPYQYDLVLTVRSQRQNYKLLLSAHPSYARAQITTIPYTNPEQPSNFCMTLRKHLEGAILIDIQQIRNDRLLLLTFAKRDELGDENELYLAVELMGRHSNISLINTQGMIIDCIKHLNSSKNTYRTLLPGAIYQAPPHHAEQLNPFTINKETLFEFLSTHPTLESQSLQQRFEGFGKDTAKECCARLNESEQRLQTWQSFLAQFDQPQPTLTQAKRYTLTPFPYETIEGKETTYATLSELCDAYYGEKAERDRVQQQMGQMLHHLQHEKEKAVQKVPKLQKSLDDAAQAETLRQKGELLTTFLYMVPKGATSVTLTNYYDNDQPIDIALNPAYSPNKNAQKYFQRYQKLKKGVHIVQEQLEQTEQTIAYLDNLISEIELASPMEIEAIKEELIAEGYMKAKRQRKKQTVKSKPLHYISQDGTSILVGKNNLQNDQLTLRQAKKTDYWLHAKNIPGSHVIVQSSHPSEETLVEAAEIAAYHSKYRFSAQVPVDCVQVKYIHKPNGAKPGFVIYEGQKTYFVTPKEETVLAKRQNK